MEKNKLSSLALQDSYQVGVVDKKDRFEKESDQGETEDEEIKMNCIGGHRGLRDSDFSSDGEGNFSEEDEEEDDVEDDENEDSREDGVVDFTSQRVDESTVCRPKPILSKPKKSLSPLSEEDSSGPNQEEEFDREEGLLSNEAAAHCASNRHELETQGDQANTVDGDMDELETESRPGVVNDQDMFEPRVETPPSAATHATKAKRVLSSNTLANLNREITPDSPKRLKPSTASKASVYLPELTLGVAALDRTSPLLRRDNSAMSDELDKRLREELDPNDSESSRENSPIPLLTPPQSPLMIAVGDGVTTVCEWPSNLCVDNAMIMVANDNRPLSPIALQKFEVDEEHPASSLTPMLQSIAVSTD